MLSIILHDSRRSCASEMRRNRSLWREIGFITQHANEEYFARFVVARDKPQMFFMTGVSLFCFAIRLQGRLDSGSHGAYRSVISIAALNHSPSNRVAQADGSAPLTISCLGPVHSRIITKYFSFAGCECVGARTSILDFFELNIWRSKSRN